MSEHPVVVYGASGYTGRLVCEYLRQYNLPFVAAGRDKRRVQEVVGSVPGVQDVLHDIVEVDHTVEELTRLFEGARVVCNTVGPFINLGHTVLEACARAGTHYLDTTGEQDWMLEVRDRWHHPFLERGLLCAPGVAQMYTTGEIAANLCLEQPGLDTLDILTLWRGFPTYASTQTIFTILKADWFYLEQNQYQQWPMDKVFHVAVPGQHETGLALPWGGTAHPVWFKDDPRVANVRACGGVLDRAVMEQVMATTRMFEQEIKPLPREQRQQRLAELAGSVQAAMPPRENPRVNASLDSVYASGPLGRAHCVIHGNCNYKQTGLLQAYGAYALTQQQPRRVGFASACQALGHQELLGVLRAFGLVMEPVLSVYE